MPAHAGMPVSGIQRAVRVLKTLAGCLKAIRRQDYYLARGR